MIPRVPTTASAPPDVVEELSANVPPPMVRSPDDAMAPPPPLPAALDPKSVLAKETVPSSTAAAPPTAAVLPVADGSAVRADDAPTAEGVTTVSVEPKVLLVTAREPSWPSEEVSWRTYSPPPSSAALFPLKDEESMVN